MEQNLPLVTICMPTYNHGAYIALALQSIIDQKYSNLQIIISDDCSTDNTRDIINEFKIAYPTIIESQCHQQNIGAEKNIQSIYPLIRGDYVCWFSGDDEFLPGKLMTQIRTMIDNPDCIFSFHAVNVIDKSSRFLYEYNDSRFGNSLYLDNLAANLIRHRCFICTNSLMINYKLSAGIAHRIGLGIGNDWLLLIELASKGRTIYIPKSLGTYRRHNANISSMINVSSEENVYAYLQRQFPQYAADIRYGLVQLYTMYIFKYLLRVNFKKSFYCLKKLAWLLCRSPFNIVPAITKTCSEFYKRMQLYRLTGNIER